MRRRLPSLSFSPAKPLTTMRKRTSEIVPELARSLPTLSHHESCVWSSDMVDPRVFLGRLSSTRRRSRLHFLRSLTDATLHTGGAIKLHLMAHGSDQQCRFVTTNKNAIMLHVITSGDC